MKKEFSDLFFEINSRRFLMFLFSGSILGALYLTSLYSYLLFHTLVELFSITISFTIFILVWNARRQIDNHYILFIGLTLLFITVLDLVHLLSYKGMPIFIGYDANLPTQLWIAARYLQSFSLLIALFFCRKKVSVPLTMFAYTVLMVVILTTIFLRIFPVCYIDGSGLTPFKKVSEYIIVFILFTASLGLWRMRQLFGQRFVYLLISANLLSICAELAFTAYLNVYGLSNLLGHLLKVITFFFWYLAIVQTGITNPGELLYRKLSDSEKKFKNLSNQLEAILDHIPGLVFYKDNKNNFIRVNKYVAQSYNKDKAELEGKSLYDIYSRGEADKYFLDDLDVINSGNAKLNIEEQWETAEGLKWVNTSKIPFADDDGEIKGVIGISMDITERREADDTIKSLLREKELILKEVHHRIKNNMNTIISLLYLQAESLKDSSAKTILTDAANRIQSMLILYDKLYQSKDFNSIDVNDYLPSLIDEIIVNFPNSFYINVEKKIDSFELEVKKLQPLGIIINELLTNIMKHAFAGKDSGSISVSAALTGSMVRIIIADNGIGIHDSIDFNNSTGFGINLVSMLVEQLEGSIRIERGSGTKFILEFGL